MKWRVRKAGSGGATYDRVQLHNSGALWCFRGNEVVAIYGPGMWITAELER